MTGTEIVPSGGDFPHRLQGEALVIHGQWLEELGHHLHHLDVDDQFLKRGDQSALQPAAAMHDQVGMPHHRPPQRHLAFVS